MQLFDDHVVGPLIDSLKDLQELLGRHQDREVQVAMVRSLTSEVAPRPGGGPACLAMGTLVARLRDDELAARRAFAESFAELASPAQRDAVDGGVAAERSGRGRRYDPQMGYKLLGFIVWQGIRIYLRNSNKGTAVKAGLAGCRRSGHRGRGARRSPGGQTRPVATVCRRACAAGRQAGIG